MSRSFYHLVWILLAAGAAAFGGRWRAVARGAWPALAAVSALYLKNLLVFGFFGGSAWLGMNLCHITTSRLPPEVRSSWIEDGVLSPLAGIPSFNDLETYRPFAGPYPSTGIAVLDQRSKSDGWPNYHHLAFVRISRIYLDDALVVVRRRPDVYLRGMGRAYTILAGPSGDYPHLARNRGRVRAFLDVWNRLRPTPLVAVLLPLLVAFLVYTAFCDRRAAGAVSSTAAIHVLYTLAVGILIDIGDNERYRFAVDPILFATFLRLLSCLGVLLRR